MKVRQKKINTFSAHLHFKLKRFIILKTKRSQPKEVEFYLKFKENWNLNIFFGSLCAFDYSTLLNIIQLSLRKPNFSYVSLRVVSFHFLINDDNDTSKDFWKTIVIANFILISKHVQRLKKAKRKYDFLAIIWT